MKETCWDDCLETSNAKRVSPNPARARSLKETAGERILFFNKTTINENNARFVFEGYYSSLVELIHAKVLLEGYSIQNHLCLGFFLKEILKREDLFRTFNDCRIKRNDIIYYGKKIDYEVVKEAIEKTKKIINEIK